MGTLSFLGSGCCMADAENCVLTFDVGGSHVSAAVCFRQNFRLGPVVSGSHSSTQTAEAFIDLVERLGREAAVGLERIPGAMLAVPGPFDLESGISRMQHKLPYLYGIDLRGAIAQHLGCKPAQVRFLNDANAYMWGEAGAGAARGFHHAVGLTLGTGIGSAFAVGGQVVTHGPGVPAEGEIWNLPYEGGIVEYFVSTRAIVGNYERRTGKKLEVVEIAHAAAGDPAAKAAFEEFGRHLGRVIRTQIGAFQPDVVVLGGGIARSPELFIDAARSELLDGSIQLRISELKDQAALVGCGVAWFGAKTDLVESAKTTPAQAS